VSTERTVETMRMRTRKLKRLPRTTPTLDIARLLSEHEEIDFLLGELNCDERAMVELVYRDGMTTASAAASLGFSEERAFRALADAEEALSRLARLLFPGARKFKRTEP
jgi:DNA-directed RNA polymerase specialized sigma24 family protein